MFCGLECTATHDSGSVRPSGQSYAWSQHPELDGPAISSPAFLRLLLGELLLFLGKRESLQSFAVVAVEVSPSPLWVVKKC